MRTKRWGGGPATLVLVDRSDGTPLFVLDVQQLDDQSFERIRARAARIGIDVRLVDFPVAQVADERGIEDILRGYESGAQEWT